MEKDKTRWVSVLIALSVLVTHSNAIKLKTKGAKVVVLNDQGFFTSSSVTFKLQTCRQVDLLLATTKWNVEKRADYTFRINVGVSQSDEKTTVLYSRKPQMTLLQAWSLCHHPIWLTVTVYQGHLKISKSCNSRNMFKYQMDPSVPIKYAGVSSSGEAAWEIAKRPDCTKPGNVEKPDVEKSGFFQLRSLRLKTKGSSKMLVDYGFIRERVQSLQLKVRGCDVAVVILCKTRRIFISETYTISLNERIIRANKTITRVRRCDNRKCSTLGILAPNGPLDICKQATTFYLTVSKGVFSVGYKCDSKSGKSWKADNFDQPFIGIYSKSKQKATDWNVMKSPCTATYSLSAPPPKMMKLMTLGKNNVIYLKDKGIPASSSLIFQLQTCSHVDLLLATTDAKLRSRNAEYTLRMNAGQPSRRETFLYADGSESQLTLQQSRSLCKSPAWLRLTFHDGNLTISELCSPHKFRWPMGVNNTIMHVGVLSDTKAAWLIANMTKCTRKGSTNKRRNVANTKQGLFKLKSIQLKPSAHARELNEHGFDLIHTTSLQLHLTTCDATTILISKPGAALVNNSYKIVINEYNKANKGRLTDIHFCKTFACESVFKVTPNTSAQDCTQTISYFIGLQQGMLGFGYSCEYEAGSSWRIKNPFDTMSIRIEGQGQNQKPWKITANDCITNYTTQKRDGLGVDISNVVRKEHKNKSSDAKDLRIKVAMNKTEVTNSPQTQKKFIGESSTRQAMSSIVRYDSSTGRYGPPVRYDATTVRYDTSTGRYDSSTVRYDPSSAIFDPFISKYDASTGRYDTSTARYDPSTGRYDPSAGRYDPSTGRYDASTGTYDTSTARYDPSTARYDPSAGRYDATTVRYDTSTGRYDSSTVRYDPSSARYDPSTRRYDPSTVRYDPSTVRYDPSTVRYDPSTVRYDPSTDRYDPSTRRYDPSTVRYDPSTVRYDPSTDRYDASTVRYDPSTGRYDASTGSYDSTPKESPRLQETATPTPGNGKQVDVVPPGLKSNKKADEDTNLPVDSSILEQSSATENDKESNMRNVENKSSTNNEMTVEYNSLRMSTTVPYDMSDIRTKGFKELTTRIPDNVKYTGASEPVNTGYTGDEPDRRKGAHEVKSESTTLHRSINTSSVVTNTTGGIPHVATPTIEKTHSFEKDATPSGTTPTNKNSFENSSTEQGLINDDLMKHSTMNIGKGSHNLEATTTLIPDNATQKPISGSVSTEVERNKDAIVKMKNTQSLSTQSLDFHGDVNVKSSVDSPTLEPSMVTESLMNSASVVKSPPLNADGEKNVTSSPNTEPDTETGSTKNVTSDVKYSSLNVGGERNATLTVGPSTIKPDIEIGSRRNVTSVIKSPSQNVGWERNATLTVGPSTIKPDSEIGSRKNVTSFVKSPSRNVGWERNATLSVGPSTIKPDSEIGSRKNVTSFVKSPSMNPDWKRTTTTSVVPHAVGATTETGLKTKAKSVDASHSVKASGSVNDTIQSNVNKNIRTKPSMDAVSDELTKHHTNPATVKYMTEIHSQVSKSNSSAEGSSVPRGKDRVSNPEHGDDKDARLLTSPTPRSASDVFAPGAGANAASVTTHSPSLQADTNVTRNKPRQREGPPHRNTTMIQAVDKKSPRSVGCEICVNFFLTSVLLIHL